MPQWDFLSFIASTAAALPNFRLLMSAEAKRLDRQGDRVVGLRAETLDGPLEVRSDLVVAADGRASVLRAQSELPIIELGAPMDVLWFKLARDEAQGQQPLGRFDRGQILIAIERDGYWQCGYVIAKGSLPKLKAAGFARFRQDVMRFATRAARVARKTEGLVRYQPFDGAGQPLVPLEPARVPLHRRCRPCHVAGRRDRH